MTAPRPPALGTTPPILNASPSAPLPTRSSTPSKPSVVANSSAAPRLSGPDGEPLDGPSGEPMSAPSAEPPSTLAEENRLFKASAEASRRGDVAGALARLDQLLAEHPRSPLAQTALVRKFRLLAGAGRRDEAGREAARYLASYPTGFAVSEAQALTSGQAAPVPRQQPSTP